LCIGLIIVVLYLLLEFIGNMSNSSTEIETLLDKICEDNDYVLAFQAQQVVRDLAAEIVRLVALTKNSEKEWQTTDLEPLLGCLTAFIANLDISIDREKELVYENKQKLSGEDYDEESGGDSESGSGGSESGSGGSESGSGGSESGSGSGSEDSKSKYDDVYVSYLEDIKCGAVKSRDRIVEWQLLMIKKIIFV
jgi:uncharacterized membrane protein YgcG